MQPLFKWDVRKNIYPVRHLDGIGIKRMKSYHEKAVLAVHVNVLNSDLYQVFRPGHHVQAACFQLTFGPAQKDTFLLLRTSVPHKKSKLENAKGSYLKYHLPSSDATVIQSEGSKQYILNKQYSIVFV
jgi:hypothetical protein